MDRAQKRQRSIDLHKDEPHASNLSNRSRQIPRLTEMPKLKKVFLESEIPKTHFKATQGFIHGATVKDPDQVFSANLTDQHVQNKYERMQDKEASRERKRYENLEDKSLYKPSQHFDMTQKSVLSHYGSKQTLCQPSLFSVRNNSI